MFKELVKTNEALASAGQTIIGALKKLEEKKKEDESTSVPEAPAPPPLPAADGEKKAERVSILSFGNDRRDLEEMFGDCSEPYATSAIYF